MQGFNMGRYYGPSDETPTFNQNKHPLGARANKIKEGILTVRFEMPYAIWCTSCPKPTIIGQGVRFNAEKKKVGNYHTTPIWSFRMKHAACGGWIEIRTDPQKSDYVVNEGAKRRDYGEEEKGHGEGEILTPEERERRRNDAFAALEGKVEEKTLKDAQKDRLDEIRKLRDQHWKDPDTLNRAARAIFRERKKIQVKEDEEDETLKEKYGLGIDLGERDEGDATRAALVEFGDAGDIVDAVNRAATGPLFPTGSPKTVQGLSVVGSTLKVKQTRAQARKDQARQLLQQNLQNSTRAVVDPFLTGKRVSPSFQPMILKRQRSAEDAISADGEVKSLKASENNLPRAIPPIPESKTSMDGHNSPEQTDLTHSTDKRPVGPLVNYESDSDW